MTDAAKARILIADDEPLYLATTGALLRKAGYDCTCVTDAKEALAALAQESFDLLLSDLNMPGNLKLELLKTGRQRWPEIPVIVVTGAPSLPTAIESLRMGIADYLLKPVKYDDLLASVRKVLRHRVSSPGDDAEARSPKSQRTFIGSSDEMMELQEIIDRIARTDTNVLITGESGTGKELVARSIHERSQRATHNFQVIDCTAIPESLFESVLFGHAKGSFTGAVKDQTGLLLHADRGTAFFDEIGELPLPLQAKLLRVIQEQTFRPVGMEQLQTIDTRFICATNRRLEVEVAAGRFRRDLYYRLAVLTVELPPLRDRGEDVMHLAQHFLTNLQDEVRVTGFTSEAEELLRRYPWPGNIRELRNAVERVIALARGAQATPEDLPMAIRETDENATEIVRLPLEHSRETYLEAAEREYLERLLRELAGNITECAKRAGVSRQGFHKLLQKHSLNGADYRQ